MGANVILLLLFSRFLYRRIPLESYFCITHVGNTEIHHFIETKLLCLAEIFIASRGFLK
jgi:hypothetical protein